MKLDTFTSRVVTQAELDAGLRDDYALFMGKRGYRTIAVHKDTSEIEGYLRRRKLKFSRNIQLTAPSDAFRDLITVQTVEGDEPDGRKALWTRITIHDRIRSQE